MRKKIKIWNKVFNLIVDFDCFDGEYPTKVQEQALNNVLESCQYFDDSLSDLKEYCLKNHTISEANCIDDIFKYVIPRTIFITRSDKIRSIALLCDYKFDIEHGIAITYENEKFTGIKDQDEVI